MDPDSADRHNDISASGFIWSPQSTSPTQSLPEQIAEKLAQHIVSGRFRPGDRVLEQHLAGEFQVSRGPVREALRILEQDGLVRILPRRGAQIAKLSAKEVREIFEIGGCLLGLAAASVVRQGRAEVVAHIAGGVEELQRLVAQDAKGDAYLSGANRLLHYLVEAADNRRLSTMISSIARQTLRYARQSVSTEARRRRSVQQWQELVRCLQGGDAAEAEHAARRLVGEAWSTVSTILHHDGAEE